MNPPEPAVYHLDPTQAAAVHHPQTPLVVIAGPGSGKTRVLTHRVAHLLDTGVPSWKILAVTFTNKAAAQMRERLTTITNNPDAADVWMLTFHATCARILRRWPTQANLRPGFTIVDTSEANKLLRTALADTAAADTLTVAEALELLSTASREISAAKNDGVNGPNNWTSPSGNPDIPAIWAAYQHQLETNNCVDFDDLLTKTLALADDPEAGAWMRTRFAHVLVDEFQDTNDVQQRIVNVLAEQSRALTVVGDPDQSIYKFRGATGSVLTTLTRHWPEHSTVILERNYRSTANICATVAALIAPNPSPARSPMLTDADTGPPVTVAVFADHDDEATWVAGHIRTRLATGTQAVLVRANHQTRAVERALTDAGISHAVVGTLRFSDRAEVKDACAWMRLLVNPYDSQAFIRATGAPKRGIGDKTVQVVLTYARTHNCDLITAARACADTVTGRSGAGLATFTALIDAGGHLVATGRLADVAAFAVHDTGLVSSITASTQLNKTEKLENLAELKTAATRSASNSATTSEALAEFLGKLALVSSSETTPSDGDEPDSPTVVISTMHAAKGREFDTVYVIGAEENIIPHARSLDTAADIAEERRLMFVACSRARRELFISRAKMRWSPASGESRNKPSRFLSDIPAHVIAAHNGAPPPLRLPSAGGGGRAPQPSRRAVPPVPPAAAPASWNVGDGTCHATFGDGTIEHVDTHTVTAVFADGKRRTFPIDTSFLHAVST